MCLNWRTNNSHYIEINLKLIFSLYLIYFVETRLNLNLVFKQLLIPFFDIYLKKKKIVRI